MTTNLVVPIKSYKHRIKLRISLNYSPFMFGASYFFLQGTKCAILQEEPTTTKIRVLTPAEPNTKSNLTSNHGACGTSKGRYKPAFCTLSFTIPDVCYEMSHITLHPSSTVRRYRRQHLKGTFCFRSPSDYCIFFFFFEWFLGLLYQCNYPCILV